MYYRDGYMRKEGGVESCTWRAWCRFKFVERVGYRDIYATAMRGVDINTAGLSPGEHGIITGDGGYAAFMAAEHLKEERGGGEEGVLR